MQILNNDNSIVKLSEAMYGYFCAGIAKGRVEVFKSVIEQLKGATEHYKGQVDTLISTDEEGDNFVKVDILKQMVDSFGNIYVQIEKELPKYEKDSEITLNNAIELAKNSENKGVFHRLSRGIDGFIGGWNR